MMWRGRRQADLEDRLRALRQEPRKQFVEEIVARISAPRPTRPWLRLGVAVAAAVLVAVPFLAFGGVGFAAHSVQATVHSITGSHSFKGGDGSSKGGDDSHKGGDGPSKGGDDSHQGGDGSSAYHEYCPPKEKDHGCKPPPCDNGQQFVDGKCKPPPCNNGQQFVGGKCKPPPPPPPPPPPHCDKGQHLVDGKVQGRHASAPASSPALWQGPANRGRQVQGRARRQRQIGRRNPSGSWAPGS